MTQLIVSPAPAYTRQRFQVSKQDWDLGDIIEYGESVEQALDNYLESHELHNDEELTNWKWRAER